MKRLVIAALVAALTLGAAAPADASSPNWLRLCTSRTTSACVVDRQPTPDSIHSITFHTGTGKAVTVHSGARAWRIVKQHSHRCRNTGDQRSCWMVDTGVTNLKFVVFPSGIHVATKRIH